MLASRGMIITIAFALLHLTEPAIAQAQQQDATSDTGGSPGGGAYSTDGTGMGGSTGGYGTGAGGEMYSSSIMVQAEEIDRLKNVVGKQEKIIDKLERKVRLLEDQLKKKAGVE